MSPDEAPAPPVILRISCLTEDKVLKDLVMPQTEAEDTAARSLEMMSHVAASLSHLLEGHTITMGPDDPIAFKALVERRKKEATEGKA